MLRKRSRPVSNANNVASDNATLPPPNAPSSKTTCPSSLFISPRFFMSFSSKGTAPGSDRATMSPTSILEPRPFSAIASPFFSERSPRWSPSPPAASCEREHPAVGLGLADVLKDTEADEGAKPESRKVLFGSMLKVQIPPPARCASISPSGSIESPRHHPIEFGVKNKSSQLALCSPLQRSPMGSVSMDADMELSEDYTRVISRGPNPRTMHIFDDCCIVECCPLKEENVTAMDDQSRSASCGFLSFCHACKKNLGMGKDIFMYRGERAFCSSECRYQEMIFEEGEEDNCPLDL